MKGRVLFVLLLHVVLASMLSGCRTTDVAGGQAAHRAALQALSSRSCKIILEEVYTPSDRPEKLRAQQVTGSYLIETGFKVSVTFMPGIICARNVPEGILTRWAGIQFLSSYPV